MPAERFFSNLLRLLAQEGWNIAIPTGGDDSEVDGLIIGTESYVDSVLNYLPDSFVVATHEPYKSNRAG